MSEGGPWRATGDDAGGALVCAIAAAAHTQQMTAFWTNCRGRRDDDVTVPFLMLRVGRMHSKLPQRPRRDYQIPAL